MPTKNAKYSGHSKYGYKIVTIFKKLSARFSTNFVCYPHFVYVILSDRSRIRL